jgi:hypothetical protein
LGFKRYLPLGKWALKVGYGIIYRDQDCLLSGKEEYTLVGEGMFKLDGELCDSEKI